MSNDFSVENKLKELKPSIARTLVPIVMALAAYLGLSEFIDVETLTFLISSLLSILYYSIARFLEIKNSKWSILLGSKSMPSYSGRVITEEVTPIEDDIIDDEEEAPVVQVQEIEEKETIKVNRLESEQDFINDFILGQE